MIEYICVSYFMIGALTLYVYFDKPYAFSHPNDYAQFLVLFLVAPIIVPIVMVLVILQLVNNGH